MTDRELLEAAAKAAGVEVWRGNAWQADMLFRRAGSSDGKVSGVQWNPLADDGDALRLAVKLRLEVLIEQRTTAAVKRGEAFARELHVYDRYAATRRAIVRAAAAMAQTEGTA